MSSRSYPKIRKSLSFPHVPPWRDPAEAVTLGGNPDKVTTGCPIKTFGHDNFGIGSKKFSITTKTGDQGFSRLFSGERVLKNSPRLDAYGDLDELVSLLSVARHHVQNEILKEDILFVQRNLFTIASELATTGEKLARLKTRVDEKMLQALENKRIALEEQVEIPKGFVIPCGNSLAASYLDLARSVARRCERKIVGLLETKEITNEIVLIWFNRLSDYLYLLARLEEKVPLLVKKNV